MKIPENGIIIFYADYDTEAQKTNNFAESFMGNKVYVDVEKEPLTAEYFDVKKTPVIVVIRDSREIARIKEQDSKGKIDKVKRLIVA